MITEFSFIELPVSNFLRAREFYESVLGFVTLHLDAENEWCLLKVPNSDTGCAIYKGKTIEPKIQSGVRMIVKVYDFQKTVEHLAAHGVQVEAPRIHADEHFIIAGFTDLDDHVWRFWAPLE